MDKFEFPKTIFVAEGTNPAVASDRFTALDAISDFSAGETVAVYQLVRVGKIELGLTAVKKPRKPREPKADGAVGATTPAKAAPKKASKSRSRKSADTQVSGDNQLKL